MAGAQKSSRCCRRELKNQATSTQLDSGTAALRHRMPPGPVPCHRTHSPACVEPIFIRKATMPARVAGAQKVSLSRLPKPCFLSVRQKKTDPQDQWLVLGPIFVTTACRAGLFASGHPPITSKTKMLSRKKVQILNQYLLFHLPRSCTTWPDPPRAASCTASTT